MKYKFWILLLTAALVVYITNILFREQEKIPMNTRRR